MILFFIVLLFPLEGLKPGAYAVSLPAFVYPWLIEKSFIPDLDTYTIILCILYGVGLFSFLVLAFIGSLKKIKWIRFALPIILIVIGFAFFPYEVTHFLSSTNLYGLIFPIFETIHFILFVFVAVWNLPLLTQEEQE